MNRPDFIARRVGRGNSAVESAAVENVCVEKNRAVEVAAILLLLFEIELI